MNGYVPLARSRSHMTTGLGAARNLSRLAIYELFMNSFTAAASARPIDIATAQGEAASSISMVPYQAAWLLPLFAATIIVLAYCMGAKKGPIPVWGSMTAVLSYSWWVIRDDTTLDIWLACM